MEYAGGVRRNAVVITLVASYVVIAALALLFHFRMRPEVIAAFEDFATPMPAATRVALSPWLVPASTAGAGLVAALALGLPMKRSTRHGLLGVGIVIASAVLVFAIWAALAPLFQPA